MTAPIALRAACAADFEPIAMLWHRAWWDAHETLVPKEALAQRGLAQFRQRVAERIALSTVAVAGAGLAGFVTVRDDNVEQLYVAEVMRGQGVARALLAHGEALVAMRFDRAWLGVAAGNTRARHFYACHGWRDVGGFDQLLWTGEGSVVVAVRRYEKWVTPG